METRQISTLLAAAILALAASLAFISSCNSDDEQNTQNTGAQDVQIIPSTISKRAKKQIRIKIKAKDNGDGLEVESPISNDCKSNPNIKGCFMIDNGQVGLVEFTFNLPGQWKPTQLTICKGETKEQCSPDLSYPERLEFFVMDDPKVMDDDKSDGGTILSLTKFGRIDLTQFPGDVTAFYLYDLNTFVQNYFYNIEMCNDVGKCMTLDPPLENKG